MGMGDLSTAAAVFGGQARGPIPFECRAYIFPTGALSTWG